MIHASIRWLPTPVTLAALLVSGYYLAGIFVDEWYEIWGLAASSPAQADIGWCEYPLQVCSLES